MAKKQQKTLIVGRLSYKMQFSISSKFSDIPSQDKNVRMVDGTDVRRQFGGLAGNVAYGLSVLNGNPCIISQVGKDFDSFYRPHPDTGGTVSHLRFQVSTSSASFISIAPKRPEGCVAVTVTILPFSL